MPLTDKFLDLCDKRSSELGIYASQWRELCAQAREANALREQLDIAGYTRKIDALRGKLAQMTELNAVNESGCNNALDRLEVASKLCAELGRKLAAAVAACAAEHPEVAELRKDAERLYWWFSPHKDLGAGKDYLFLNVTRANTLAEWRSAIDAAIGASHEPA